MAAKGCREPDAATIDRERVERTNNMFRATFAARLPP